MKKICILLFFSSLWCLACSDKETEPEPTTVFEGKNLVTFGNSITAESNSWAYQLFQQMKFGNLYNGAVGGAVWSKRERVAQNGETIRTQNYTTPGFAGIRHEPNNTSPEAVQRTLNNCAIVHIQKYLNENYPAPDVIILSYGTNDVSAPNVLGDASDALGEDNMKNLNTYTLAGSTKWCLQTLQTTFPKAKIYVALPIQAESKARNDQNIVKIGVIKQICDGMSIPYFDCFAECDINQSNAGQYLRDGTHPNAAGQMVHANYIIKKLIEQVEKP